MVNFIGLNPSTADENTDDPTIIRCVNFAKSWGYGGIYMTNLFAYRSTDPKKIKKVDHPIGNENNQYLKDYHFASALSVACWGSNGTYLDRDVQVIKMFRQLYCLKMNKSKTPTHPLYLKSDLKPVKMGLV
jgi:hypothetical protein